VPLAGGKLVLGVTNLQIGNFVLKLKPVDTLQLLSISHVTRDMMCVTRVFIFRVNESVVCNCDFLSNLPCSVASEGRVPWSPGDLTPGSPGPRVT